MPRLNTLLTEVVDRYLNHTLSAAFRVALYDYSGALLAWRAGRNDPLADGAPPAQQLDHLETPRARPPDALPHTQCTQPWLLDRHAHASTGHGPIPDSAPGHTACIRLSLADAPYVRWMLMYGTGDCAQDDLLAACELGAQLLGRELSQHENISRLRHTVREQETVINHISDGLLVMDRFGILKYCNTPASQILKISVNASIGRPIKDILDFELALGNVFDNEEGYIDRELQIESPTLNLHLVDTAIPIRDESGTMISVVNTFRKIERVKELSYRMTMDRPHYRFADIRGDAPRLRAAIGAAQKAARSTANVVLYGESGTGKELFAQAIHADGTHASGPFIALNCAALPRDLVESELFGYTSGSFTGADKAGRPGKFELASGGTLFLDEIADMPLDVQAKLLRVLQERRVVRIGAGRSIAVDVRVIAASNQKLGERVAQGSFREDLYYRLNVIEISIPALREREGDIALLLNQFFKHYCQRLGRDMISLAPHAMRQLEGYHWPGNVRQLQNIVERLANLSDDSQIDNIPPEWLSGDDGHAPPCVEQETAGAVRPLSDWEQDGIRAALAATGYNVTRAASALGISRPTLYAKMKRYGIRLGVTELPA